MNERVIVSLTTYNKRVDNIPVVLDTIFSQTVCPDRVVINLSLNEYIPESVRQYIDNHDIEMNFVKDTKVYKKLIPTLKRYPDDCVISIDDDFLYPKTMIEDFMSTHDQYPHYPISGNREVVNGMQCHCGCASLTKAEFFGRYLDQIDDTIMDNCPSDDMVYTYFSNMNGHPYLRTRDLYFTNMPGYNEVDSYSSKYKGGIIKTFDYLNMRFGACPNNLWKYYNVGLDSQIITDILESYVEMGRNDVRSTFTYRMGAWFLKPITLFRSAWHD